MKYQLYKKRDLEIVNDIDDEEGVITIIELPGIENTDHETWSNIKLVGIGGGFAIRKEEYTVNTDWYIISCDELYNELSFYLDAELNWIEDQMDIKTEYSN
jgi:hypothetical protein